MIRKDMLITDIVEENPEVAEILLEDYGIHCFSCGASYFETLEEGLMGHGLSDEEIDNIVKKLNEVNKSENNNDTISVSDKTFNIKISEIASEKIKSTIKEGEGIRIKISRPEEKELKFRLIAEHIKSRNDSVEEVFGIKFYIDEESLKISNNITIDYFESPEKSGFEINTGN